MTDLAILCINGLSSLDSRFFELASFVGVNPSPIQVCAPFSVDGLARQLGPIVKAIGISASTLSFLKTHLSYFESFISWLTGDGRQVFVYGFEPNAQHEQVAKWLTKGEISRIVPIENGDKCIFPAEGSSFARPLSGSDFSRSPQPSDCGFEIDPGSTSLITLVSVGDKATFLHSGSLGGNIFLWATKDIPSLKQKLHPDSGLSAFYDSFLPPVVFIRCALRGFCWENPVRTARIIIDDPLLTDHYGFLDYNKLLRSLESLNYAVTIAYIPWNHRRTKGEAAQFFLDNSHKLSVCIHGCDHTKNEFGITGDRILEQKASLALARMIKHQERTGLPFENVMVFPQGRFSKSAISALRRSRYLAAINSTSFPIDADDGGLTFADELLPATNRYSGFPIFHRRYARGFSHFAVDMFLGKPVYMVEHHEVFQNGCGALERCVNALKVIEPSLTWPNLSSALQRVHLRKTIVGGDLDVLFFTNWFEFENSTDRKILCRFAKPEPEPDIIKAVLANNRSIQFQTGNQSIEFQLEMKPGENLRIKLEDRDEPSMGLFTPGLKYRLNTGARRHLSEFRDNHLVSHPWLLKAAKRTVRLLKASADARSNKVADQSKL